MSLRPATVAALAAGALLAAAAPAFALDEVTFGTNWVAEPEHGGFYQAVVDGTYEKYGLKVTIVPKADHDTRIAAYLIDSARRQYDIREMALEFGIAPGTVAEDAAPPELAQLAIDVDAIKRVGRFTVPVEVFGDVVAQLKVVVAPEGQEPPEEAPEPEVEAAPEPPAPELAAEPEPELEVAEAATGVELDDDTEI